MLDLTTKPKLVEKHRLFRDAISFNPPKRVPHLSNVWTWLFLDAGYDLRDVYHDYDLMYAANDRFLTEYPVDLMLECGMRNPVMVAESLHGTSYNITADSVSVNDRPAFSFDQYQQVTEDFYKSLWEIMLFTKYPDALDMTADEFARAVRTKLEMNEAADRIFTANIEKHDVYTVFGHYTCPMAGLDYLFGYFRGIKGLSSDMRRDIGRVKACCEALDELFLDPIFADMDDGPDETMPFDLASSMMVHSILNPKQFETLMWPSLKKIFDGCAAHHKQLFMFSESSWLRFADYLQDIPKGTVCMHVEIDDIREVHEKLPNLALSGGLMTEKLEKGTPQECIDMAQSLIDDFGRDGGLILSENKMCSFKNDINATNYKPLCAYLASNDLR
jgi:hypothetical protein